MHYCRDCVPWVTSYCKNWTLLEIAWNIEVWDPITMTRGARNKKNLCGCFRWSSAAITSWSQFYRSGFVMGIWPDWFPLDPLRVCVCLSIWYPVSLAFLKESPSSSVSVVPHFFGQGHHWISVVSSKTLRRFSLQGIWGPVSFRTSTSEYYSTILKFDPTFSEVKTSIYARSLSYPCEGWLIMWQIKMSLRLIFSVMNLMDLHESSCRGVIFVEPHRKRQISLCLMFKTSFI